jgi:hypothetical protein
MIGQNITNQEDLMQKTVLQQLFNSIAEPSPAFQSQIEQLRNVLSIDKAKYRQLKTRLPYFVSGIFYNGIRRTENFSQISHFVIDLDHLLENEIDINSLKAKLVNDERIALLFVSPSGNGLKIVFNLGEALFDAMQFKLFYKTFTSVFAQQYNILPSLDKTTSDVSRACFLSADKEAFFNVDATAINIIEYIDFDDFLQIKEIQKELKSESASNTENIVFSEPKEFMSENVLSQIKTNLNPKIAKREKDVYVPKALLDAMNGLQEAIEGKGLKLESAINIQYGKQIKASVKHLWAEVNVFYGKKGFKVIPVSKTGSNPELSEILTNILENYIYTYDEKIYERAFELS